MSKIFLVEDDQFLSRVYERAFRLGGHEIEIAYSGEEAWKILTDVRPLPSVIVLDILLPNMSGTELLERINKDDRFNDTPVVMLTNSFNQDIEKKLIAAGADLFLLKVDHQPQEIVAKIEDLIRKKK